MNIKAYIVEFNFSKEYFIKLLDPNNEEVANDFLNKIMVVLEKYMINNDKEKFNSNFDLYKKMNDVILK
jgi:hypothetical protein